MSDKSTDNLVKIAAGLFIAVVLGGGGWFGWRHFAYQAAIKECTPATASMSEGAREFFDELDQRYGQKTDSEKAMECMANKGFPPSQRVAFVP